MTPPTAAPPTAPHAIAGNSVPRIMLTVVATLVPATLYGFWLYGWPAIDLWLVTVLAALLGEGVCLRLAGRRAMPELLDGSALLTGWLLAISLPPWAPWWIGLLGGLFATVIAKQVFGGLGQNLFNPAMVARVFLLISFPVQMTVWIAPLPITAATAPGFSDGLRILLNGVPDLDAVSSASLLGFAKTELSRGVDLLHSLATATAPGNSLTGARPGSLGETASMLIAGGGLALLFLGIITWHIPVAMLAGIAIPAFIAHAIDPLRHLDAATHLLSGGAMLGAFFIATDTVTSPNTRAGQLIFGAGCGLLTYVIRTWGGYPEGVAFAVLLMNALTPVIDHAIRPRILGRDRRGAPLDPAVERAKS
ncbi:MAG: RnfABCDGE type electron transport complex subunit D [Candidatus Nitricoxidivorans perseverans]|uniref:Ion-translocating oxidoreductase complex subunit D n=1 Tax=Candidatus Nitricoxidivorans perseverans TaxID=2975601 RepID=A0AA49FLB2_9PROT|nr:MAG: RnfABCDGE type electron transport complex subunit D [Candidatus Nitricoxidivorans perseverans]